MYKKKLIKILNSFMIKTLAMYRGDFLSLIENIYDKHATSKILLVEN